MMDAAPLPQVPIGPFADFYQERTRSQKQVVELLTLWHSCLPAPCGFRLALLLKDGSDIIGVSTWGRPVARMEDQTGATLEHLRMALASDLPKNTPSWFLARNRKEIRAMFPDVRRLITYVNEDIHSGITYRADNWQLVYEHKRESSRWSNREGHAGMSCRTRSKFERSP